MMAETETSLRKSPGTAGEDQLDDSSSSAMDRATSLTAEEQHKQQQQQQKLDEQQEEEEQRFPAHEACWEGREEEVLHMLRLDDPDYMKDPCHLEQALCQKGTVPVCMNSLGHGGSHQHCPKVEGTLAVLAVKKARFECANALLCSLLFVRVKRAAWCNQEYPKWTEPGPELLCKLLRYVGLKHCAEFASLFSETLPPDCSALLTLVAACVLGDAEAAAEVVEKQDQAYWTKVERLLQRQIIRVDSTFREDFIEKAATVGACIGGKAACVAMVRKMFPHFSPSTTVKCHEILRKGVLLWEPEEILKSLGHFPKNYTTDTDLKFFLKLTKSVVQPNKRPEAEQEVLCERSKAESSENLVQELLQTVRAASKMDLSRFVPEKKILHILSRIMSLFSCVDPNSKTAELLNGLASLALYMQCKKGILCGDFTERLLARCKGEKRGAVLETMFEFWAATRSLHMPIKRCICGMQVQSFVMRELFSKNRVEAVEILSQYWTTENPEEFFVVTDDNNILVIVYKACSNCGTSPVVFIPSPAQGNFDPEGKLKSIFKPKVRSLQQLSKLAILQRMDKERKLFHELGLPGGVSKLFMVHDFLKEWGCGQEAKE